MRKGKALDKALAGARTIAFDIHKDKYVIMSDQHMGDGTRGSDDFRQNREAYKTALRYYFDGGYRLVSMGDVEELWECDHPDIRETYPDVYDEEKRFYENARLYRIYGNHDIFWKNASFLHTFLDPLFPGITVHGSVLLQGTDGRIFLAHGHQGEFFSDRAWRFSRRVIRSIWKPLQRAFGFKNTGAAQNRKKRTIKEWMYYQWARVNKLVFIAGHTHRAMFASQSKIDRMRSSIAILIEEASRLDPGTQEYRATVDALHRRKGELQEVMDREFEDAPETPLDPSGAPSPCYFNDGCCSYTNGLTAIELDEGTISLVKWDRQTHNRTVYETDSLLAIFRKIALA